MEIVNELSVGTKQKAVYDSLPTDGAVSIADIARALGMLKRNVTTALLHLKRKGLVHHAGWSNNATWARTGVHAAPSLRIRVDVAQPRYMHQVTIPALQAPPIRTTAVRSVFDLGTRCGTR